MKKGNWNITEIQNNRTDMHENLVWLKRRYYSDSAVHAALNGVKSDEAGLVITGLTIIMETI